MEEHPLIGQVLLDIQITSDKDMLRFVTCNGNVDAVCFADCCSTTWVEHIELPAMGFPCTVSAVEDIDMDKEDEWPTEDECIAFYGCKITTDKGHIIIDYRNSSNGYYGGSLDWGDRYSTYSKSAFERHFTKAEWKPLSEVLQ